MRVNSFEIIAITALFINYMTEDVKTETTTETSIKNSYSDSKSTAESISSPQNVTTKERIDYWMRKMGPMQDDLINVQAVIVKDEDLNDSCEPASRKSDRRYLMCAGSILNRNHVLTSATCLHEATHIRHNIHAPLAVVIAPLKKSIQVIPVIQYFTHPNHQTNPYSQAHVKHNVAIIKLSCRVDMENYQKIELPLLPMRQTCNEENCVVAIFRRIGKTNHVMFQMLAPHMPYFSRRRKETSFQDVELHRSKDNGRSQMIDGPIRLERPKRKLAKPPSFMGKYEPKEILDGDQIASATETTSGNSTVEETTALTMENDNISSTIETSLHQDVSKALSEPQVVVQPVKSFVVRSSEWYLPCAHTGAPVLFNHTQSALVAIPCNGRQPRSKWYYTDLYDNAQWIRQVLHEVSSEEPGRPHEGPLHPGNNSGCSTCIFNFFIEIGCKEKGNCAKNVTTLPGRTPTFKPSLNFLRPVAPNPPHPVFSYLPAQNPNKIPAQNLDNLSPQIPFNPLGAVSSNSPGEVSSDFPGEVPSNSPDRLPPNSPGRFPPNSPGEVGFNSPGEVGFNSPGEVPFNSPDEVLSNFPGEVPYNPLGEVSPADELPINSGRRKTPGGCTRNSVGIKVGQGCDKKNKESNIPPKYRTKSVKPISGSEKMKHLLNSNSAVGYVPQLQQPVTVRTFKTPYRDYLPDKAKYPVKDSTRISAVSKNYKKPPRRNFHRDRAADEIGLQNIEGASSDWLSEIEKRLDLNPEVKPELVKSRRPNTN